MRGRLRFGRVLAAIVLAALLGGGAVAAGSGSSGSTRAPVEAQVLRQLATKGHASFWVVLRGQADVSAASRIHDRATRGEVVYKRLTAFAKQSQAPVRSLLDARGIRYQPFWIVNAIHVKSAGKATLDAVAARPDVREIRATHSYAAPKPIKARAKSPSRPSGA